MPAGGQIDYKLIIFIYFVCSLRLYNIATETLLEGMEIDEDKYAIKLTWPIPQCIPQQYIVSARCSLLCSGGLEQYNTDLLSVPGFHHWGEAVKGVLINGLWPASDCRVHIRAIHEKIFNDPGIYINATTLTAS